jgi:hypothetical protein
MLATYPAHLLHLWFGHRNNVWARIQIIKLSYAIRIHIVVTSQVLFSDTLTE